MSLTAPADVDLAVRDADVCAGRRAAEVGGALRPADVVGPRQQAALDLDARVVPRRPRSDAAVRCLWCGRRLPDQDGVGRRRRYCAQSCRQRAYESRHTVRRGLSPDDGIVLTLEERDDLADRLYQVQCAAEDVATALAESAGRAEIVGLVEVLLDAARAADRIR